MRKPRDFDAELKALGDKARDLKGRKVQQLGELVIATGADALSADAIKEQAVRLKRAAKKTPLVLSAVSGDGVNEVLRALFKVIERARKGEAEPRVADAAWQP